MRSSKRTKLSKSDDEQANSRSASPSSPPLASPSRRASDWGNDDAYALRDSTDDQDPHDFRDPTPYDQEDTDGSSTPKASSQRGTELTTSGPSSPIRTDTFWCSGALPSVDPVDASQPLGQSQLSLSFFPALNQDELNPASPNYTPEQLEFTIPMDLDTSSDDEDLPPLSRCPTRNSYNSTPPLDDNYPDPDDPLLDCIHVATSSSPNYPHIHQERVILPAVCPGKRQKYPQPAMRRDLPVNFPPLDVGAKLPGLTDEMADWNGDLNGGFPPGESRWMSNLDGAIPPPPDTVSDIDSNHPTLYPNLNHPIPLNWALDGLTQELEKVLTKALDPLVTDIQEKTSNVRNSDETSFGSSPTPSRESSAAAPNDIPQWTRPWKRKEFKEDGVWLCPRCERFLDQENPRLKDREEVVGAHYKLDIFPPFLRKATEPLRRRKCGHCERENFCHLFWHSNGGSESTQ
ncbi:hypothetical protein EDB81DRAFT_941010 [Dactylonectria macrodidyma]|uniref:Uncharacterized protein n=1 Tax=Dactylonectria macrodidyma TaxID=307937 RepID=A0A9P9FN85_9HYPO|nr:hypothetical protein EDB81DRAFT_941010 [Dactylonectria macrodidyma]